MVRACLVLAALAGCLAITGVARAQDSAAAGKLFEEGLADMKAGAFERGCPKLAESHRVDPRPGTLFTLAECEAGWGKLATAVTHYEDFLRLAGSMQASTVQQERAKLARDQIAKLRPRVPTITLVLPASAPRGTVVQRNGVVYGATSLGAEVPVDPGETSITAQAPGGPVGTQKVVLAEGEHKTLTLVVPAVPPAPLAPVAVAPPPRVYTDADEDGSGALRPFAWTVGATGLAAIGVGAVTGALALSKKGAIEHGCDGTSCTPEGKAAADSGQGFAAVSTATFIGGAAALAVATVLFVVDKPRRRTSVRAEVRP